MTLEFEVDVDRLTDGGIKDMPTWVKLNDEGSRRTSTVYVNTDSYWHVVDENAKLRKLLRDMYRRFYGVVIENWSYSSEDFYTYEQRMRELGVEVNDD